MKSQSAILFPLTYSETCYASFICPNVAVAQWSFSTIPDSDNEENRKMKGRGKLRDTGKETERLESKEGLIEVTRAAKSSASFA